MQWGRTQSVAPISVSNYDLNRPNHNFPGNGHISSKGDVSHASYPSNPVVTGPGLWYIIHLTAHDADTPEKIKDYIEFLFKIVTRHPCGECRTEGTKYLQMTPPNNYEKTRDDKGRLNGMFLHSWMFHNNVNQRLGKPTISYRTAWEMFDHTDQPVCPIGCGKSNPQSSVKFEPSSVSSTLSNSPYESDISIIPSMINSWGTVSYPSTKPQVTYLQPQPSYALLPTTRLIGS